MSKTKTMYNKYFDEMEKIIKDTSDPAALYDIMTICHACAALANEDLDTMLYFVEQLAGKCDKRVNKIFTAMEATQSYYRTVHDVLKTERLDGRF